MISQNPDGDAAAAVNEYMIIMVAVHGLVGDVGTSRPVLLQTDFSHVEYN